MTTSNFSKQKIYQGMMYLFLVVAAFISLFPFFWMVVSSTNTTADINQGKMSFGTALIDNFTKLNQLVDLPQIFWNTAKVAHNSWLINSQMDRDPEFVKNWPFQKTPNVALTSNGVVLKYNVATIAPYALGLIEMTIPYARLTGVLKPELAPARH